MEVRELQSVDDIRERFGGNTVAYTTHQLTEAYNSGDVDWSYNLIRHWMEWLRDEDLSPGNIVTEPEPKPKPEPEIPAYITVGGYIADSGGDSLELYANCSTTARLLESGAILFEGVDPNGDRAYAILDISLLMRAMSDLPRSAGPED